MPAEKVFGEQDPAYDEDGELIVESQPKVPLVDVRWGRDTGYVQIVTKAEDPNGGRWAAAGVDTHFTDGMYVNLDRASINNLIRHLRRARDQAFGRDE